MSLPDFDYMFALRIELSDLYEDEYNIINELKKTLLDINQDENIINQHIINFYKEYNIEIDETALTEMDIPEQKNDNIEYKIDIISLNNIPLLQNVYNNMNIINQLNDILSNINLPQNLEDVATPLDESEFNKIKTFILEEKHESSCSICLGCLDQSESVCELPCNHIYHEDCIMQYLKDYHRICPVCRTEVGKRRENI